VSAARLGPARQSGVWATIRLLPRLAPLHSGLLAALVLAGATATVALTVMVGRLLAAVASGHRQALTLATLIGVLFVVDTALNPVRELVAARLGRKLSAALAGRVVAGALRPVGVAHLDDPTVAGQLSAAKEATTGLFRVEHAVPALTRLLTQRLAGISAAALLFTVEPWMALSLTATWIALGRRQDRRLTRSSGLITGGPSLRRSLYLRDLALSSAAAMEVRVFALQRWLVSSFADAWRDGTAALRSRRAELTAAGVETLALGAVHLVVLSVLAAGAASGRIPVADLGIALQAIIAMVALGTGGDAQLMLRASCSPVPDSLAIAELGRSPDARPTATPAAPRHGIRFEGVSFAYRSGRPRVLDGLDLWIPAGTSLALVGDNGAGKSTLVKLLAALYHPGSGRITVDDRDLRDLDPAGWRRQLAVVFQDHLRYNATVRDNIGLGRPDAPRTDTALERASRRAGFPDVVHDLPAGWDTQLGAGTGNGIDLSGGQWQRLALARALFAVDHGARVLVLDEPAAHLDAQAERRLYADFLDLTRGLTTVLVSHRFATVRLADRIAVLHRGRVAELGTHDELMAQGGRYAAMFIAQTGSRASSWAGHA
jgi:ATP-binding cassette subfamily B protein